MNNYAHYILYFLSLQCFDIMESLLILEELFSQSQLILDMVNSLWAYIWHAE